MDTLLKVFAIIFFSGFLAFLSEKNESVKPEICHKVVLVQQEKPKSKGDLIIEEAKKYVGTKYRYGGKSPKGFDCSGFTQYIFKKEKIKLDRSAKAQSKQGEEIEFEKAAKGDLLFFGRKKSISHVGIVISEIDEPLTIIHAATSQGIVTTNLEESKYWQPKMKFVKRLY